MRRRYPRRGFTVIEIVMALTLAAILLAVLVWAAVSTVRQQDAFFAERQLDRVASAQLSHALAHGEYAYGAGGSVSDLTSKLPRDLVRDLVLTHGEAADTEMVSVAVGREGTLVLSTVTPNRLCLARMYPAPTATDFDPEPVAVEPGEACIAAGFLPAEEPPAWVNLPLS